MSLGGTHVRKPDSVQANPSLSATLHQNLRTFSSESPVSRRVEL